MTYEPPEPDSVVITSCSYTTNWDTTKGRTPTQAEVMATKLRVDESVAPYIQRPGVSRPGPRPPKVPVR